MKGDIFVKDLIKEYMKCVDRDTDLSQMDRRMIVAMTDGKKYDRYIRFVKRAREKEDRKKRCPCCGNYK
jgi:hypothetical protein